LSRRGYQSGERLVSAANDAASPPTLRKELNLFDAVAIVVGTIIGSGIFLIPSSIAAQLNSLGAVLLVWVIGGILTLCGAIYVEKWSTKCGHRLISLARVFIGITLIFFAVEYFLHPELLPGVPLRQLTPNFIPGHLLWGT
jgi:hypothetical protein